MISFNLIFYNKYKIYISYIPKNSYYLVYVHKILLNFFPFMFFFYPSISKRTFIYLFSVLPFLESFGLLDI